MKYFLSAAADVDLQDIYQHGYGVWGERRASSYIYGLHDVFERLAMSPGIGRHRPDLHVTLRSFPHDSHQVFYTPVEAEIAIVRVLHGAADQHHHFRDYDPVAALKR